jgi:hydrogenase-4 membrane subunit HyfE
MKFALTVALLVVLALLLWRRRKRVGLALQVGVGLYVLLMITRLVQMRDDSDQLITLGTAVGALLVLWLLVRGLVAILDQRRERRRQGLAGADVRSARSARAER